MEERPHSMPLMRMERFELPQVTTLRRGGRCPALEDVTTIPADVAPQLQQLFPHDLILVSPKWHVEEEEEGGEGSVTGTGATGASAIGTPTVLGTSTAIGTPKTQIKVIKLTEKRCFPHADLA